ncbi:MAG TPA: fatty acid desaturase [Thermoanaerobaculia bacterium]|nr:fatty acid desaturase [Thermoanaerobaculia bacterium]
MIRTAGLRIAYTFLRSFYAILPAVVIWGTLFWTPVVTFVIAFASLHLATRVEEIDALNRWCRRLRIACESGPRPRVDVHPLIFLGLSFVNYTCAFWIYLHFEALHLGGIGSRVLFVLGAGLMLGWTAGVNLGVVFHNHLHRGTFRSARLNRWIGRLWTLPSGWPSFFWQYKHTAVHHQRVGRADDWVQPKTNAAGEYESIHRYVLCHWPWRYARHLWREFAGSRRLRRRALLELAMFLPFWAIPLAIDPIAGIGLWLYPHWFGSAFILGTGMYTQHAGGTAGKKHSGSTTFLSEFFNITMFNVGYHTEHHANPSVHWTELPQLHETLREELIAGGAHIVAYGSYHASHLLSRRGAAARSEFFQQHPAYVEGGA